MLSKILSISTIGNFHAHRAWVELKRNTIIYADNGRGKSTLCAILRSLSTGQPTLITQRKTLGVDPKALQAVSLMVGSRNLTYGKGQWSDDLPQLSISDSEFISENVYTGNTVDLNQRRNLLAFVLGADGVKLRQEVEALDSAIRDKNSEINNKELSLRQHIRGGMAVTTFLGLQPDPDIDAHLDAKRKEVDSLREAAEIEQAASFQRVVLPDVSEPCVGDLLQESLPTVSADG